MMSQVCCSRSLFLAVLCCFSAVFRALFSLLFWRCGHQKPGFLRRREGSSLYFSSIISEISERRYRQRPELSSCSCLFSASGIQDFQSLAADLFLPRARTRAGVCRGNQQARESGHPELAPGLNRGRPRSCRHPGPPPFRWGDEGEEGELICQTRTTRKRMPDGKPSNFQRSAAPVWRLAQL